MRPNIHDYNVHHEVFSPWLRKKKRKRGKGRKEKGKKERREGAE